MTADPEFWRGRRILLTGHTGFKGAWCAHWLATMGADVTGFALPADSDPAMSEMVETDVVSLHGDLRNAAAVRAAVEQSKPQIVLHLAAQPIVREGYRDPVATFATNVMGTVHLLEALRGQTDLQAILSVTTDKVYANDESGRAFAEEDPLGGHDPYSASKSGAELATAAYATSFFDQAGVRVATARGGNVIGGGDFSMDRLVPDIVRAIRQGRVLELRNPGATRPWQHVLDCLDGYLTLVQALVADAGTPRAVNIGPDNPRDVRTVAEVTAAMQRALGVAGAWSLDGESGPREMAALALDPSLAQKSLGWRARLSSDHSIRLTADWYAAWANGANMTAVTSDQIDDFMKQEIPA